MAAVSNVLSCHYRSVSADDTSHETRNLHPHHRHHRSQNNNLIPGRTMPFDVPPGTTASPLPAKRPLRTLNIPNTRSTSLGYDQRPITGVKRKTAVELLEESKAYYVKSERVLDVRQEWPHSKSPIVVPCNVTRSPSPLNEIIATPSSYSFPTTTTTTTSGIATRSWLTPKAVTSNSSSILKKEASPNMSPAIEKKRLAIRKENPLSFNVGAVKRLLSKPEEVHIQMNPVKPLPRGQCLKPQPGTSLGDLSRFRTEPVNMQVRDDSQQYAWVTKQLFHPLSLSNHAITPTPPSFIGHCACHSLPVHTFPVTLLTPPPVPPKSPGLGARLKELQQQMLQQQQMEDQALMMAAMSSPTNALPPIIQTKLNSSKPDMPRASVEKPSPNIRNTNSNLTLPSSSYDQHSKAKENALPSRPTPYLRSQSHNSPATVREETPMRRLQSEDVTTPKTPPPSAPTKMAAVKSNTWIAALHKSLPDLTEDKPTRSKKILRRAVSHISTDTTDTTSSVSGKGDEAEASSSSSNSGRTTTSSSSSSQTSSSPSSSSPMPCSSQTSSRSRSESLPPERSRSFGVLSSRDRDPHRTSDYASRSPSFKLDAEGLSAPQPPQMALPVNHLWLNRTLGRLPPSVPVRSNDLFMAMLDERPVARASVVRSKSDTSHRHPRSSSTKSLPNATSLECERRVSEEPRPAELDAFFDRAMLNPPSLSEQSSPVFFSSVSSFDSWQKRHGDASGSSDAEGGAENVTQTKKITGSLVGTGEPSIVERNARIVKWLFNCRKAQSLSVTSSK